MILQECRLIRYDLKITGMPFLHLYLIRCVMILSGLRILMDEHISQPMSCGHFFIDIQKMISYKPCCKRQIPDKNLLHLNYKCAKESEQ